MPQQEAYTLRESGPDQGPRRSPADPDPGGVLRGADHQASGGAPGRKTHQALPPRRHARESRPHCPVAHASEPRHRGEVLPRGGAHLPGGLPRFSAEGEGGSEKRAALRQTMSTIFDTTSAEPASLASLAGPGRDAKNGTEEEALVSFLEIRASEAQLTEIRGKLHELLQSLAADAAGYRRERRGRGTGALPLHAGVLSSRPAQARSPAQQVIRLRVRRLSHGRTPLLPPRSIERVGPCRR